MGSNKNITTRLTPGDSAAHGLCRASYSDLSFNHLFACGIVHGSNEVFIEHIQISRQWITSATTHGRSDILQNKLQVLVFSA